MPISTVGIIAAQRQIGGGGGGITATFRQSDAITTDLTTYTFSSQSIGSASATRRVVVTISRRLGRAVNSATIGGVTATVDADLSASSNQVSIISAVVPTGTTADVVITFSASTSRCGIGVWTLTDGDPTGQVATDSGDPSDLVVTTTVGDVVIAGAMINSAGTTYVWTGATERFDELVEADIFHTGADTTASGASTAINVDASPGATGLVAVAAAYA